jgi:hypothetical protein
VAFSFLNAGYDLLPSRLFKSGWGTIRRAGLQTKPIYAQNVLL